jgi:hypothetical protein
MRNLYSRAASYQPLTPFERALLRLVEGLICTALVAALPIVADALASTSIDWGNVLRAALAAGAVAMLLALVKYARAHADPVLTDALDELVAALSANLAATSRNPADDTKGAPDAEGARARTPAGVIVASADNRE